MKLTNILHLNKRNAYGRGICPSGTVRFSKIKVGLILTGVLATAGALVGCKPTEKNYREAYEAAQSKKKQAEAALGIDVPLQQDNGISLRKIGNDSVWVSHELVKAEPDDVDNSRRETMKGKYGIAISRYRMPTNAKAQMEDLRARGYDAFLAGNGSDRWYVIIAVEEQMRDAAAKINELPIGQAPLTLVSLPAPVLVTFR